MPQDRVQTRTRSPSRLRWWGTAWCQPGVRVVAIRASTWPESGVRGTGGTRGIGAQEPSALCFDVRIEPWYRFQEVSGPTACAAPRATATYQGRVGR